MTAEEVAQAGRVLAGLGLATAFGHVSERAGDRMRITPAAELATVRAQDVREVALDAGELPPGTPPEAWAHLALYRARPDVRAVARAMPPSAFAVSASVTELRPVHGQACWLGERVPVHDGALLLRTEELAAAAAADLPAGEALLLRGNGALTTGDTPGLAVARMHLLAAACEVWSAARDARPMDEDEVASWRAVGGELLPRLWRHLLRITEGSTG